MSQNGDHVMAENELLEEFDELEEAMNNIDVEKMSSDESESEAEELDLTNLGAQFEFRTKRRQKLRAAAKSALVDKYASTEEFRQYLASKSNENKNKRAS